MTEINNAVWTKVAKSAADPDRVRRCLEQLGGTPAGETLSRADEEQARLFAALFSGSTVLSNLLLAHPEWLSVIGVDALKFPRREQGLRQELSELLRPLLESGDQATALSRIREFKQREMLRIGVRDLARLGNASEITRDISDVADVCLSAVWDICERQFAARYGRPWHQDGAGTWQPTTACVLGMGKLGGQELNYSSDVDVLFVYSEEGQIFKDPPAKGKTPRSVLANHQFFNRIAETFIGEVSRLTPEGSLFRIDLRLRPEGDSGPLSRSLESYENYYAQWGQTWERMMLIKARGVAGSATLAGEFLEMVQPFRYPRAISENVLNEIGAMKDRIETEVVRSDELERNVKLGRGGIREIEFIAQSQQLLNAGKQPFLQGPQTLPTLDKLAQYGLIPADQTRVLSDAYVFLRDVEHRLQMEENLQTHSIPVDRKARERLARLMGFATATKFETARRGHSEKVRKIFDKLFKTQPGGALQQAEFPNEFAGAESEWKRILANHSFRDPDKAFRTLREFVEGPGYVHVSPRTAGLAHTLLPRLFSLCPTGERVGDQSKQVLSDPDRVVTRLDSFIAAYGARAVLFELWNSTPTIFELLLLLFDRSEFLAELAIRTPDLVDELVMSGRLRQRKSAEETLRDLRHGLKDKDQQLWIRRYHQAELMRIGLRDILGLADPEQYLTELSALADACLQYALEIALRKQRLKTTSFVIVGLGKLGGSEIDYGSDLDIIFVADSKTKNLQKLQQVALDVMDLISNRTEMGVVFHTDARLRPDGEKGLLVNTLDAYEEYYRRRALLWEIQSITRVRPVAGDMKLGEQFQRLAATLTDFRDATKSADAPVSFSPDWRQKIHQMRLRIEKERTPAGMDELAIKTGKGGLMDAEFIAQTLCLANGWQEPNTVRALERGNDAAGKGELTRGDFKTLIENYRHVRRLEGILRRWSYEGEVVLPDDPAPYYRVSVRCGFATADDFRAALATWRRAIRGVYQKVFAD